MLVAIMTVEGALPSASTEVLAKIAKTQVIIPAAIEFVDIAGLVKGAAAGEGLDPERYHFSTAREMAKLLARGLFELLRERVVDLVLQRRLYIGVGVEQHVEATLQDGLDRLGQQVEQVVADHRLELVDREQVVLPVVRDAVDAAVDAGLGPVGCADGDDLDVVE